MGGIFPPCRNPDIEPPDFRGQWSSGRVLELILTLTINFLYLAVHPSLDRTMHQIDRLVGCPLGENLE